MTTTTQGPGAAPFFSVVIPTRDRWPVVQEAVESVLSQTFTSFELIVVDDGSADGTAEKTAERHPHSRIVRLPGKGVSAARNAGVAAARGGWITFLDSDDLWLPQKLEKQKEAIAQDGSIRALFTGEIWERKKRRVNPMKKHAKDAPGPGGFFERSCRMCLVSASSIAVRKDVFGEVGLFDESMPVCEDFDMWLRIMARHEIVFMPEKLIVKRNAMSGEHREGQLSNSTWGMDRYRIYALEKLLANGQIEGTRRRAALDALAEKAAILANGAARRGKADEAETWRAKERAAQAALGQTPPPTP